MEWVILITSGLIGGFLGSIFVLYFMKGDTES